MPEPVPNRRTGSLSILHSTPVNRTEINRALVTVPYGTVVPYLRTDVD